MSLSPAKQMEMESTTDPNWLELPREVTQNILKRVGIVDIVTSACLVCPLWWNICKDPLMWRTIDMGDHRTSSYDLTKILLYAIDRSCGQVEDIDIVEFCSNQAAESLTLFSSRLMQPTRFEVLEIIGGSCPLLKSLKLGSTGDNDASAISKTMSGLSHLKIFGGYITEYGLLAILEGCPHLETLHLQDCPNLNLTGNLEKRCRDQIKEFTFVDNYQEVENYLDESSYWEDYEDFEAFDFFGSPSRD